MSCGSTLSLNQMELESVGSEATDREWQSENSDQASEGVNGEWKRKCEENQRKMESVLRQQRLPCIKEEQSAASSAEYPKSNCPKLSSTNQTIGSLSIHF